MKSNAPEPRTFDDALASFEQLETRLDLPSWKIRGVFVWKLLRFWLFSEYRVRLGINEEAHPQKKKLKPSKFKWLVEFRETLTSRNPLLSTPAGKQRVVITHTRKTPHDGRRVDILSYPVWRDSHGDTAVVLDRRESADDHLVSEAWSYEALKRVAWINSKLVPTDLSAYDYELIDEIEQFLAAGDPVASFSVEYRVKKAVASFVATRTLLGRFLRRVQPKFLYLVVGYGNEAAIAAAQDNRIPAVEFQHGTIGRGHLGYDFDGWTHVPYFPDRILAFGPDWYKSFGFPENCQIDPIGNRALERALSCVGLENKRNQKQLLVLSQGNFTRELLPEAANFAFYRPDWRVIIRPHPSEDEKTVDNVMRASAKTNNWLVDRTASLYEQARQSSVVFGVNSTALVEALMLGCRVAVLSTDRAANYLNTLVRNKDAQTVADGEELARVIEEIPEGNGRGYFAEPVENVVAHVEG